MEQYKKIKVIKKSETKEIIKVFSEIEQKPYIIRKVKNGDILVYQILKKLDLDGVPYIQNLEIEEEWLIITEEYIDKPTLEEYLHNHAFSKKEAVDCIVQLCDTLKPIHEKGIVHRDIKPENIFYDEDKPILFDFDIARHYSSSKSNDTSVLGSAGYAAPEQYGYTQTDPRTDIYALGIILKQCIGDYPYYQYIVRKACAFDPKNRYQSVQEMKNDILGRLFIIPGINNGSIKGKVISWMIIVVYLYILTEIPADKYAVEPLEPLYLFLEFFLMYWALFIICNYRVIKYKWWIRLPIMICLYVLGFFVIIVYMLAIKLIY